MTILRRIILGNKSNSLKMAAKEGRTILNYWSPGYKKIESVSGSGKELVRKNFVPTSTLEAAIAYVNTQYGPDGYTEHKQDIHPGHTSIEVGNKHYLSVGTNDAMSSISLSTSHDMVYTESLLEDILGFRRFPELRIDFYTLDFERIIEMMHEFKNSKQVYSLLGKRFNFGEGESCATASFLCLDAGGIEQLLRPDEDILARRSVITPSMLADYAKKAKNREVILSPAVSVLSDEFYSESKLLASKVQSKIDHLLKFDVESGVDDSDENSPRSVP